jgi:hypothetical protein
MRTKRVLPFLPKAPMISKSEWGSFIRTRKMLDEVRQDLAFLENEWEGERRRIEQKFRTGGRLVKSGKTN